MQIPSMICSNELLVETKVDFYFNVFLISWLITLLIKKKQLVLIKLKSQLKIKYLKDYVNLMNVYMQP